MGRQRNRHDELIHHLPNLQNLIKRDPDSYVQEFQQQLRHLETWLTVSSNVSECPKKQMLESLSFIAHTLPCYPKLKAYTLVPLTWMQCLEEKANEMHPELRMALVTGLLLLCQKYTTTSPSSKSSSKSSSLKANKSVMSTLDFHQVHTLCFTLLGCKDKALRAKLLDFLVHSLTFFPGSKSKPFQHMIFQHLEVQPPTSLSVRALQVCILLFRKKIWYDKIMANKIAQCCFSKNMKIQTMAIQFLLSSSQSSLKKSSATYNLHNNEDNDEDEDDDEDDEENMNDTTNTNPYLIGKPKAQRLQLTQRHLNRAEFVSKITKKSKKNQRRLERTKKKILQSANPTSSTSKSTKKSTCALAKYTPLEWLFDPHVFAEHLLKQLKSTHPKLDLKLLYIQLLSMCIAVHQLLVPVFYATVQKYLQPHQKEVTKFLAYTAQAVHAFVPPDWIAMVVRKVADQFINDHCAAEVITVGLHSIREIVKRMPLALDADLLLDLIQYQSHREKSVAMAAKSLVAVYRELCPSILPRKERGKECSVAIKHGWKKDFTYGEQVVRTRVEGVELLEMEKKASNPPKSGMDEEEHTGSIAEEVASLDESDTNESDDDNISDDNEDDDDENDDSDGEEEDNDDDLEFESDEESESLSQADTNDTHTPSDVSTSQKNHETNADPLSAPSDTAASLLPLEATTILTEEDYAHIAKLKQQWKATHKRPFSSHSSVSGASRIDPGDLLQLHKKPKLDKAGRLALLAEQKQDEVKKHRGPRFVKTEHMSKTKKELAKTKNFKMIAKSRRVLNKKRGSLRGNSKIDKKQFKGRIKKRRGKKK